MRRHTSLGVVLAALALVAAPLGAAENKAKWDKGMDDDAGRASSSTTDLFTLPGADPSKLADAYPVRDRLYRTSLDGTWDFKLVNGLAVSEEDWRTGGPEGAAPSEMWGTIEVPGNWETQGKRIATYGNQIPELSGLYKRTFQWVKGGAEAAAPSERAILRFGGVLYSYRCWLNGQFVGEWGSAFNESQFDVTDLLRDGVNELRVQVMTRSRGWLFDTNDCWNLAGIFREVELYTVPKKAYVTDIVFQTPSLDEAKVKVMWKGDAAKCYVALVDDEAVQVAGKEMGGAEAAAPSGGKTCTLTIPHPHAWSPEDPCLYDLVVTLVDGEGKKIQRLAQKVGLKTIKMDSTKCLVNGRQLFINGVAWNEIDPKEGRAISYRTRRENLALMKKAHVNCIRTAHYPFNNDFYELCDEMGFYVIDEVPFGSRGREMLHNAKYEKELLDRTLATIRRDRNHACVLFWTFGNENDWTKNTGKVVSYAKELDPTHPRGLAQIGSSQFMSMIHHPERDVDFYSGHYMSRKNMEKAEEIVKDRPMMQTEFAHAFGNGFNDFEDRYTYMREHADRWMGGCVWAWVDQCVMQPTNNFAAGLAFRNQTDLPKDMRRDLPAEFQGNAIDDSHYLDSWGDRGTDGIVYGDGTPKEGYWLLKKLYGEKDGAEATAPSACAAPLKGAAASAPPSTSALHLSFPLQLRIGRKWGMGSRTQSLRKTHASSQQPYIVPGEVQGAGCEVRYYFSNPAHQKAWLEGTVEVSTNDEGVITVAYDLAPNDAAAKIPVLELGFVVPCPKEYDVAEWSGMGPWTSVPGKNAENTMGVWSLHKDDYRFDGPRGKVRWALARANGGDTALIVEPGEKHPTVSFENVDGQILITADLHAGGYGGKGAPHGLKAVGELKLKGSFRVYAAKADPNAPDVVPDMTYSHHYGY